MQACSDLSKLYYAILRRLLKIRILYKSIFRPGEYISRVVLSYAVIELDNLMISGLREFTVSTLLGARTKNGIRVKTNVPIGSYGEALAYMLSVLNFQKFNKLNRPMSIALSNSHATRNPKEIEKIFNNCNASNIQSLLNALALNFTVFDDIATFRNFYAHRNFDTFSKVRRKALNFGITKFYHTDDVVLSPRPGRPVSIFEDWLYEIEIFFDELTR